jgi:HrpA-like RNA helicase
VTIDDIDVVIDSGLARRSEVRNGVEGLFISQISQADCLQRAGRAGRTKAGEYILASLDEMPCLPFDERPEYATPEILRKHIDRLALRLANVGIDIEMLDFYHDPSRRAIKAAKQTLMTLGALTSSGEVTSIGRQMERFPVESSYARMLVEGSQYDTSLQVKLAAIIAIQEVGGIVKGGTRYTGWRKYTRQTRSDLIGEYDVYLAVPEIDPELYEELGIITKNIDKASEVMERLHRDLGLDGSVLRPVESEEIERLLQCIIAGQIDQLWMIEGEGVAVHLGSKQTRELSSSTVVAHPKLVAGTPFDLQIQTQKGDLETLHLVQGVTEVNPRWLETLAPNLFSVRQGKTYFDSRRGTLATRQLVRFNGRTIEGGGVPITKRSPRDGRLFSELYGTWVYEQLEKERRHLQQGYNRRIPMTPLRQVQQRVRAIVGGAISLDELSDGQRDELAKLGKLQTYIGEAFMVKLGAHRRSHSHRGEPTSRRSWQPQHKRKYDRRRGR